MTTPSEKSDLRLLLAFFILSFLLAWGVWFGLGALIKPVPVSLTVFGAWSPTVAALLVTGLTEGRRGVTLLLRRVTKWRVNPSWYGLAMGGPVVAALLAMSIVQSMGGTVPTLADVALRFGLSRTQAPWLFAYLPVIFLVTLVGGPVAEEVGWRGYAQTRLQEKWGPVKAGLLIGVLWAIWHLPLFSIQPAATADVPLVFYLPLVTALAGLFGWLYSRTRGSVLIIILMHTAVNVVLGALGLVTTSTQLLTTFVGLMWIALGVVSLFYHLQDQQKDVT